MLINYGSPAHIMYILIALGFAFLLYWIFRKKSEKSQKILIYVLMAINIAQHLFKSLIYPQHFGEGFNALNTAYNTCALLILISPLAMLLKCKYIRDYVFYIGSAAGMVALCVPYWHIGMSAFSWDVYRFFLCHALLLASSVLPLLFGFHRASYKRAPLFPLYFFGGVLLIILNDIICIKLGIYIGAEKLTLIDALYFANPTWSFGPPEAFAGLLLPICEALTPRFMLYTQSGRCVPVLWYFIPLYILITLLAFALLASLDAKSFKTDLESLKKKIKNRQK